MRPAAAALAAALLVANVANAAGSDQGAPPKVQVELTEDATVSYAWNNRDFSPNDLATVVNDDWGVWYNRLHGQVTSGAFRFGMRLDNAWYFTSPDPTAAALTLTERRPPAPAALPPPSYFRLKEQQAGLELSNRYINWMYPAKISAGYSQNGTEVTFGDVYAEFGHGIVLSVRKHDELHSDDTVRGVRAGATFKLEKTRLKLTAVGGSLNPLRIDEGSGRYLGVDSSVTPGFLKLTEAGMPRAISTDFAARGANCASTPTCTYAPDRVVAGQFSLDFGPVELATQGSMLLRQMPLTSDSVRSASSIASVSEAVTITSPDGRGSLAFEGAGQKLSRNDGLDELPMGYALYASGTYDLSPVVVLVEARHYRRLFPLLANVNVANAREFSQVAWNAPPTTEAPYIDTEFANFSTCVTGGRGRADATFARGVTAFGWLGYWQTFSELQPNDRCETGSSFRNDVFDLASGFELRSKDARSRATVTIGARFDDAKEPFATPEGTTRVYYREIYARYDAVKALGGPFALELQGWHRRRHETLGVQATPWYEGENVIGLDYGAAWAFAFGQEYNTDVKPPTTYFNGSVRYKPTSDSSIGVFVGQRRGALRCVGGVCRVVPGFE
ncbi:MAG TPA: hypothetical protein VGQ57_07030, partial [Polyangiaceae bacterium]|nr:hypothetical protein [Polyangiaceae bacterium]